MNNVVFEKLKNELFNEVHEMETSEPVSNEFKVKFLKLVEYCTFSLMEQKENFFAHFIIQLKREMRFDLPTALASRITGLSYTLYFNPFIFLSCTMEEMKALLKHEVYHIISLHHLRARSLTKIYSAKAVNIAMDITVNQYILNLPLWSETLDIASKSYNVSLDENGTLEGYAEAIQEAMNRMKRDKDDKNKESAESNQEEVSDSDKLIHDISKTHDLWKYEGLEADEEQIREVTKNLVNNSTRGIVPESVGEIISTFNNKPEIHWFDYLKKMIGTVPSGHKKTVTRRNRRQPERLDIRGTLNKHTINVLVAIDISGSMSDKEIEKVMTEIMSIVKNYNSKITIIECDSDIRRVYTVRKLQDLKKKVETKGATRFTPVFEYINKNNLNNSLLIYFTDGLGEKELAVNTVHRKVLWVLTGKEEELSLSNPPGAVKKLSYTKKTEDAILAIEYYSNELKDMRSVWATQ